MWAETEVLEGFARVPRTTKKNDARACRRTHGKLIEGDTFAASLLNANTSGTCEAECADRHLWDFEHAVVIRDRAYDSTNFSFMCLQCGLVCCNLNYLAKADWRAVGLAFTCALVKIFPAEKCVLVLWRKRRRTVLLNFESVRRARNAYSLWRSAIGEGVSDCP